MSIALKLKKVTRMSTREMAFRAKELLRIREERRQFLRERETLMDKRFNFFRPEYREIFDALTEGDADALKTPHSAWHRSFFIPLDGSKAERFRVLFPEKVERTLTRADRFCRHEFECLGMLVKFSGEIPWQCDPATGRPYPSGFYRDIRIFKDNDRIDIKNWSRFSSHTCLMSIRSLSLKMRISR